MEVKARTARLARKSDDAMTGGGIDPVARGFGSGKGKRPKHQKTKTPKEIPNRINAELRRAFGFGGWVSCTNRLKAELRRGIGYGGKLHFTRPWRARVF